jgi:hypothetical protein
MYRADGLIGADGSLDEAKRNTLEGWLKKLAVRMDSHDPDDNLLNPNLPSGYTYLLQLIGHDLSDSVPTVGVASNESTQSAAPARLVIKNARRWALSLETIYGLGPDEASFAYQEARSPDATAPRDQLFIRQLAPLPHPTRYCACHDIRRIATDPLLADPRNDAHAILAQLAALFHLLHNQIVALIGEPSAHSRNEGLYRRYLCARTIVTLIYRNIIRVDVMGRILHPDIQARYSTLRDTEGLLDQEDGAPLEFSHGAFRFGHAMVRSRYMINSDEALGTEIAISRTSQRQLNEGPQQPEWLVDWARFFSPDTAGNEPAIRANFARKIGPQYSDVFSMHPIAPPKDPVEGKGLAYRDLRSAAYAGLWSVPALCAELRASGFADIVPEYDAWKARIAGWLGPTFTPEEARAIANDPPLPFFVLFEAGHSGTPGTRLGPVGSILVAEAIYGALLRHPTGFEGPATLAARIKNCCGAILGDQEALSDRSGQRANLEIGNMPQLLQFMASNGAFVTG